MKLHGTDDGCIDEAIWHDRNSGISLWKSENEHGKKEKPIFEKKNYSEGIARNFEKYHGSDARSS